jgi:hypothetical protein
MVIASLLLPEATGKKFGTIVEKHLTPLRTNVAHALFEADELGLSVDDYLNMEELVKWLPVTKVMIRRMLRNEFPSEILSRLLDLRKQAPHRSHRSSGS